MTEVVLMDEPTERVELAPGQKMFLSADRQFAEVYEEIVAANCCGWRMVERVEIDRIDPEQLKDLVHVVMPGDLLPTWPAAIVVR